MQSCSFLQGNNGYVWISRTTSDQPQQMLLNPKDELPTVQEDEVGNSFFTHFSRHTLLQASFKSLFVAHFKGGEGDNCSTTQLHPGLSTEKVVTIWHKYSVHIWSLPLSRGSVPLSKKSTPQHRCVHLSCRLKNYLEKKWLKKLLNQLETFRWADTLSIHPFLLHISHKITLSSWKVTICVVLMIY